MQLVWSAPQKDAAPVVLTNRGLVFGPGLAADTFSLRCNEAYGVNTSAQPQLFLDDAGRLALVTYEGVRASADRGCTWQDASGLPDISLGGFTQSPQQPSELLITTQSYQVPSQIFASQDYGRSWSQRATNQAATAYQALLSAPDGRTVFASGNRFDAAKSKLVPLWAISHDEGKTWEEQELEATRYPLAVHPANPQLVFARQLEAVPTAAALQQLVRSDDGGKTFTKLLEVPAISAFASTPDGATLWLGSSTDGLYRSDDAGKRFARVQEEQILGVFCLHHRLGRLWLCARWAPNRGGIWSSDDDGKSWDLRLGFDQVQQNVSCPAQQVAVCAQPWRDWEYELLAISPSDAGVLPEAGTAPDAGTLPEADAAPQEGVGSDTRAESDRQDTSDAGAPLAMRDSAHCSSAAQPTARGAWLVAVLLALSGRLVVSRRRGRA
jgi:photosystem II stability/assembly factor-like uncharacterized protein